MSTATYQEQLVALHQDQRNSAGVGLVLTHALWIGAVAVGLAWPSPVVWVLAFGVIGIMQYRLVMSCHEAVHKTLLFPVRLNEAVGLLHCAMVGINFIRYRRQHEAHHRAETVGVDPDGYIYEPVLRARPGWPRVAVWIAGIVPEIIEKFRQKGVADAEDPRDRDVARRHSLAIIIVQAVLLVALSLLVGWWAYPLLWLAPLMTVAVFLNRTRVIIEHGVPHMDADWSAGTDHAEQDTIDVLTNPVERFVFAPFDFNYHYAHHRIQSIPHYNNAALSELLDDQEGRSRRVRASYMTLLGRLLWQNSRMHRPVQSLT